MQTHKSPPASGLSAKPYWIDNSNGTDGVCAMQALQSLIEDIKAEDERRFVESYRFMEEQKIKKALAPAKWQELKDVLAEHCAKIKASSAARIVMEDEGLTATITNLRKGGVVSLQYVSDVPCIQVRASGKTGTLGFRPSFDGNSVELMEGQIPRDVQVVALNLMKRVT